MALLQSLAPLLQDRCGDPLAGELVGQVRHRAKPDRTSWVACFLAEVDPAGSRWGFRGQQRAKQLQPLGYGWRCRVDRGTMPAGLATAEHVVHPAARLADWPAQQAGGQGPQFPRAAVVQPQAITTHHHLGDGQPLHQSALVLQPLVVKTGQIPFSRPQGLGISDLIEAREVPGVVLAQPCQPALDGGLNAGQGDRVFGENPRDHNGDGGRWAW